MSLFVYLPEKDNAGRKLLKSISHLECKDSLEIFFTFHGLDNRLRISSMNEDIVLLLASKQKDLDEFLANQDSFNGKRVVVIVPDLEEATISKAHRLRPRYLCSKESDFLDVAQVLERLLLIATQQPH
jgi:hypothetical protein